MNSGILFAVALSTAGSYFMLQDEDIRHSQLLAQDIKRRSLKSLFQLRDTKSVQARLGEIGLKSNRDVELFRINQLSKVSAAGVIGLLGSLTVGKAPFLAGVISIIAGAMTYIFVDRKLTERVLKYRAQIESEFPAIVEMMTLSLSAGETPVSAMSRIADRATGPLAGEFRSVINSVKAGTPFHIALDEMGREIRSTHIRRFVDAMITAMLRGAPLIDVLQRHAQVAREAERNAIMSAAGKAEISMMIPVVFLILPISILFALWPSLSNLNLFLA